VAVRLYHNWSIGAQVAMQTFYVAHEKGTSQGLLVRPDILEPPDLHGKTFGTPFTSTAHYHMMFIQTLFPDVRFDLVNCNADCPDKYDEGSIDGAFVWGGTMENMKRRNATMLFPAQVLSDWGKPTFNAISVREDFAARRPDVVARIAGVVARLDADYLDAASTRWGAAAGGYLDSVAAAYGASAPPTQTERDTAAEGLSYFAFVEPDAMLRSAHLGGGIAAALEATAQFHLETDTVAAVAPPAFDDVSVSGHARGTGDIDAFYANTTTAQFLADGLAAVDVGVLDAADTWGITSIPTSGDSTCSGTVDLTATTGTLTDGSTVSYSDDLACEWRIASGGLVELTFNVFSVWTGDVVEVFDDATLVAKLHGFDRAWPPLRTNGAMTVKFTTDSVTERAFNYALTDGWTATYDAAASGCDAAYCGAHGTCDTGSGLCTCDAGYGGADCSHAACLGTTTLTASTGEFRSSPTAPDRDTPYPNSADCRFVVETSFNYVSFTIAYDIEPTFDFVAVKSGGGDGETWARQSGADSDTLITVPTTEGKASLVFTSDARGRRGGFRATYVAKDAACASDADCGHGTCEGGSCVCAEGYGGLQCSVAHCLDRALVVTDGPSMVMVSQAPGEPVPAAASCTWEFQAAAGQSVRVVVERLDLEPERSSAKLGDKVVIRSRLEICVDDDRTQDLFGGKCDWYGVLDADGVVAQPNNVLRCGDFDDADFTAAIQCCACGGSGYPTEFILSRTSFQKSYEMASQNISLSLETDRNDVGVTYGGLKATAYAVDACPRTVCPDQCLTGGPQGPGCYAGGRAVGCACDLTACLPGTYFDEATGGCEACLPGTFQSAIGRVTACQNCPANFFAPASGAATCCQRGYVLVDEACRQCGVDVNDYLLDGATCDAVSGTTVATLEVKPGYFRFSPESTFVYRCLETDDACRGSSPGVEGYCRAHAHGPLCMLCDDRYFRRKEFTGTIKAEASCVACARTGEQISQLYSIFVMAVVWVLVIVSLRRLRNRFNREWFEAALIQFVYFGVTMSRFIQIHQVAISTPLSKQFIRALEVITFDLSTLNSIARCHVGSFNYF
jgi:ABC-type taurine transport system substrate-binding protein